MHSSSADCVRGEARLSSSASTTFANTGPGRNANSLVRWSNTLTPVTSLGSTSGVSWMRAKEQSSERASARASVVLPTPGTSSTSTCPSASSATTARSTIAGSPLTARRTFAITRSAASRAPSRSRSSASAASIATHPTFRRSVRQRAVARRGRARHRRSRASARAARGSRRRRATSTTSLWSTSKPMSVRETSLRTIRSTPLRSRLASARCESAPASAAKPTSTWPGRRRRRPGPRGRRPSARAPATTRRSRSRLPACRLGRPVVGHGRRHEHDVGPAGARERLALELLGRLDLDHRLQTRAARARWRAASRPRRRARSPRRRARRPSGPTSGCRGSARRRAARACRRR